MVWWCILLIASVHAGRQSLPVWPPTLIRYLHLYLLSVCMTLVCEVIRYRFVQFTQNLKKTPSISCMILKSLPSFCFLFQKLSCACAGLRIQLPISAGDIPNSTCRSHHAGRLRFLADRKVVQVCTGSKWLDIATRPAGQTEEPESNLGKLRNSSAASCLDILQQGRLHIYAWGKYSEWRTECSIPLRLF